MKCSMPESSVHEILQARILEWLPFPSPEDLPDLGIEPGSPALAAELPGRPYVFSLFDTIIDHIHNPKHRYQENIKITVFH